MKAGVLTVSDRGALGEREDLSGPALSRWLSERRVETARYEIIPDERPLLTAKLREWADAGDLDLILTTGGTGVAPRDVTPEATMEILDRLIPGLAERMRAESIRKTPMASLSRVVGTVNPGSVWDGQAGESDCVKIMTGAMVPPPFDTVIQVELSEVDPGGGIRSPMYSMISW